MIHLLSVHNEGSAPAEEAGSGWPALVREGDVTWVKTWRDLESGKRYCWWGAPGKEALEALFRNLEISWEDILEVKFTTPRDWIGRED